MLFTPDEWLQREWGQTFTLIYHVDIYSAISQCVPSPRLVCNSVPQAHYSYSSATYYEIPTALRRNWIWKGSIVPLGSYILHAVSCHATRKEKVLWRLAHNHTADFGLCWGDVMWQQVHHYAVNQAPPIALRWIDFYFRGFLFWATLRFWSSTSLLKETND